VPVTFSVIIPTLGRPELDLAVRSVLGQERDDFEIIVVNDGGPPIVGLPDDPRIVVVDLAVRSGPSAARNAGLRQVHGRYVLFLDDDDQFLPVRLTLAAAGLEHSPVAVCEVAGRSLRARRDRDVEFRTASVEKDIGEGRVPITLGCVAVDREICPDFDPRYFGCEDWEWWIRLAGRAQVTVVFSPGWAVTGSADARELHGTDARVSGSRMLLEDHREYFERYPIARAYRQRRLGLLELERGDRAAARAAFVASFRSHPNLRSAYYFLRARSSWLDDRMARLRAQAGPR
jgi:glycosyltransferase involved in cell wall biosynthesis